MTILGLVLGGLPGKAKARNTGLGGKKYQHKPQKTMAIIEMIGYKVYILGCNVSNILT